VGELSAAVYIRLGAQRYNIFGAIFHRHFRFLRGEEAKMSPPRYGHLNLFLVYLYLHEVYLTVVRYRADETAQ